MYMIHSYLGLYIHIIQSIRHLFGSKDIIYMGERAMMMAGQQLVVAQLVPGVNAQNHFYWSVSWPSRPTTWPSASGALSLSRPLFRLAASANCRTIGQVGGYNAPGKRTTTGERGNLGSGCRPSTFHQQCLNTRATAKRDRCAASTVPHYNKYSIPVVIIPRRITTCTITCSWRQSHGPTIASSLLSIC
jgi:hypothetical protein